MKIIGLGFVAAACLYFGLVILRGSRARVDGLRSMCRALEIMQAELSERLTPMPELIKILSERCTDCAGNFFTSLREVMPELGAKQFSVLWVKAVRSELTDLDKEEMREVEAIGSIIGKYDLSQQLKAVSTCLTLLRERYNAAIFEYPVTKKLCLGLSSAAGILLTIVLI